MQIIAYTPDAVKPFGVRKRHAFEAILPSKQIYPIHSFQSCAVIHSAMHFRNSHPGTAFT